MTFSIGQLVEILSLNRRGRIIGALGTSRYRVQVGGLKITSSASNLRALDSCVDTSTDDVDNSPRRAPESYRPQSSKGISRKIDLHGYTVQEALSVLDAALNRAVLDGVQSLEVVHGIGSGRIKQAVHDYCLESKVISRFEIRQFNPGVTDIFI